MKSLKLLTVLLVSATAIQAQQVKFSDLKPEAGKTISFTYNPAGTELENSTEIKCQIFSFFPGSIRNTSIKLSKEGPLYKGTVPTADSTALVALSFSAPGYIRDSNPEGYYTKLYRQEKLQAEAYASEANILDTYGRNLGMKPNLTKSLSAYDQAFILKPALKNKLLYNYLSASYRLNNEAGNKLINEQISKAKSTDEKDLTLVYKLYVIRDNKPAADSVKNILLKNYPTGEIAYSQAIGELYSEKDAKVLEDKLNTFITRFHLDVTKKEIADQLNYPYTRTANAYAKDKNYEKFEFYTDKITDKVSRANSYNNLASSLEEKKEDAAFAAKISKKSMDLITAAKGDELPSNYADRADYNQTLTYDYGMFADTYALALYNLGKYKEAAAYEEKSLALSEETTPDMHVSYVRYLKKDGQYDKALTAAETAVKEGKETDSVKNDLKLLYTQLGKKGDFNTYLLKLEEAGSLKEREVWMKKMINKPAPLFSLKNLKGETVNLADLRGKTVVVDYWATWCPPCKASFPGMQMAVNKYKDNPNVVFLFIDTWQRESNREEVVNGYIAQTKYTFNVLLDTKNKIDPAQFDTVNAYKVDGIPTKFVIDAKGNIRFKLVGFSGSDAGIVKEIDMMIALASGTNQIAQAK